MTFLDFIQFACAAIFVTYIIAINQFKKVDKRDVGGRPQPDSFTFFPRKGQGFKKKEMERIFGPPAAEKSATIATGKSKPIPAAKQRKLDREAAKSKQA